MRFGRSLLSGIAVVGAATAALAGCSLVSTGGGSASGYGPWLESVIAPTGVFDADVVDTGSVEVHLRDEDGEVLSVERVATAVVDDVDMVAELAANPHQEEMYATFSATAARATPMVVVYDDALSLTTGMRYRFFLAPFGSSTDLDYQVLFAWDLASDDPARAAPGWRSDLEALRAEGLIEGANADGIVAISQALMAPDPTERQRDIIVELLGESMLPRASTTPPTT